METSTSSSSVDGRAPPLSSVLALFSDLSLDFVDEPSCAVETPHKLCTSCDCSAKSSSIPIIVYPEGDEAAAAAIEADSSRFSSLKDQEEHRRQLEAEEADDGFVCDLQEEIDYQFRHVGFSDDVKEEEESGDHTPKLFRRDTPHYNKNAKIHKPTGKCTTTAIHSVLAQPLSSSSFNKSSSSNNNNNNNNSNKSFTTKFSS